MKYITKTIFLLCLFIGYSQVGIAQDENNKPIIDISPTPQPPKPHPRPQPKPSPVYTQPLDEHSVLYDLMHIKSDTTVHFTTDTVVIVKTAPEEEPLPRGEVLRDLLNNMLYIEGGTFDMGATSEQANQANNWEKPAHRVTLSSFYMCRFEVMQREWLAIMGKNPSSVKRGDCPVREVSWKECQKFIAAINELTGLQFRLPTEAEWEYAARGGRQTEHFVYSGSNEIDSVAWYFDNSDTTAPVGTKRPNELGLYDMTGNVWEWCQDFYGSYPNTPQTNPTGPTEGTYRVVRGGSWDYDAEDCRITNRAGLQPNERSNNLGLRLVLSPIKPK